MTQKDLFEKATIQVLKDVVDQLGGPKVVGPVLYTDLSLDAAEDRLSKVLNINRREILDPVSLIKLLRLASERGVHHGMYHICAEALYKNPEPTTVKEVAAEIAGDIRSIASDAMSQMDERIKKLERLLNGGGK